MPFRLEAEYDGRRLRRAERGIRRLAKGLVIPSASLRPIVRRNMRDMLDTAAEAMRQRHGTAWAAGSRLPYGRAGRLHVRSGRMIESLLNSVKVTETPDGVTGTIGGPFWMVTHEEGRTIRARNRYVTLRGERIGPFLFIPLPDVLDAQGVPRTLTSSDWRGAFVIRSRKRHYLIVRREGGGLVPMFLLRKRVTVRARLGLRDTISALTPVFVERLFKSLDEEIRRASRAAA